VCPPTCTHPSVSYRRGRLVCHQHLHAALARMPLCTYVVFHLYASNLKKRQETNKQKERHTKGLLLGSCYRQALCHAIGHPLRPGAIPILRAWLSSMEPIGESSSFTWWSTWANNSGATSRVSRNVRYAQPFPQRAHLPAQCYRWCQGSSSWGIQGWDEGPVVWSYHLRDLATWRGLC